MIEQYSFGLEGPANANNNVIDIYKKWTAEEVRADLQSKRNEMVTVLQNITHDFNKSSVIRSNNAFLGKEVYIVGRKRYDKRGGVGQHHYESVFHADNFIEVFDKLKNNGYTIIAVDNIPEYNPKSYIDLVFPPKTAFVFGEENSGLDKEVIDMCDDMVYVRQYGSVRSLNVACAASVLMAEYSRRYRLE